MTVAALVLLAVILTRGPIASVLGKAADFLARPLWGATASFWEFTTSARAYLSSKDALLRENLSLKESLYDLSEKTYQYALLGAENQELKTVLGRQNDGRSLVLAAVLARPPVTEYDTLVIDLGSDDGIEVGMRVLMNGTFTIGEVVRTYRHSALVSLYSTNGYELEVDIGTSSIPAIAKGSGGGSFVTSVPRGTEISAGDGVRVPGIADDFIGTVEMVDAPPNSSFSTVYLSLPVNYHELRYVYVAVPQANNTSPAQ